jgi:hypothetical protein
MASGTDRQREELSGEAEAVNKERRAKAARRTSRFINPKPPLGSNTKSRQSFNTKRPSGRYAPSEGPHRLLSEPTPSHRLWVATLGATPALPVEHNTDGRSGDSKPELSTLLESGTFYFALTLARIYW